VRYAIVMLSMLLGLAAPVAAQLSVSIGLPGLSIGLNVPMFPELVRVPGYPVYYAPRLQANFFFYDGVYWVFQGDDWYVSSWYDGPWDRVVPERVPLFVLRIPVRYYRSPPAYFHGWRADAPPRWGDHWGPSWQQQRGDWDRWDRRATPAPAPLPTYQRQYSGNRYPQPEQQQALRNQHYRYQPRDAEVRQHVPSQPPQPPQRSQTPPRRDEPHAAPPPVRHDPAPAAAPRESRPPTPHAQPPAQGRQRDGADERGQPQDREQAQQREQKPDKGKGRGNNDEPGHERK
jgi:hypothetical protein